VRNGPEAALAEGLDVRIAEQLLDVCHALGDGVGELAPAVPPPLGDATHDADLSEVRGQHQARRALEIAAAGSHSLLMVGPPGSGKSMLASRLPGILPPLTEDESLEVAAIGSISPQGFAPERWGERPYRAPHHTSSAIALVGGGSTPRPGEITLAHHGVLFLDELPEFQRAVLEVLREPLETGQITISRAARQADFPARFQLVAAMNPCPCGFLGDTREACRCAPEHLQRYLARISGPLLDRIDLQIPVPRLERKELLGGQAAGETSFAVRARVIAARARQRQRAGKPNARLSPKEIERDCAIDASGRQLLEQACQRLKLSARGLHRVLRVARTIGDLAGESGIRLPHLAEALQYRAMAGTDAMGGSPPRTAAAQ
jgi:magnesium chelatase family protein